MLLGALGAKERESREGVATLERKPRRQPGIQPQPVESEVVSLSRTARGRSWRSHEHERLYYRAYQVYRECYHEPGIAEVCDSLANLLLNRGKTRAALVFAKKGLDLKRKWRDRPGEAMAWGTLGRVYRLQAKDDEARGRSSRTWRSRANSATNEASASCSTALPISP